MQGEVEYMWQFISLVLGVGGLLIIYLVVIMVCFAEAIKHIHNKLKRRERHESRRNNQRSRHGK